MGQRLNDTARDRLDALTPVRDNILDEIKLLNDYQFAVQEVEEIESALGLTKCTGETLYGRLKLVTAELKTQLGLFDTNDRMNEPI